MQTRRGFVVGGTGAALGAVLASCDTSDSSTAAADSRKADAKSVPDTGTHVVTLGTAGGPRVHGRSAPAQAVVVNGAWHLVDCGAGTLRQLEEFGVTPDKVQHVWFTHLHSDHMADYASLVVLGWLSSRSTPLTVHGPGATRQMHDGALGFYGYDIKIRVEDEGRPDPSTTVTLADPVTPDTRQSIGGGVTVTAARVQHPPTEAYGFRFDTPHGSVTFSGDTRRSKNLIKLAGETDVLVHEVMHVPAIGTILEQVPDAASLKKHLLASHTTTDEVGQIAARAGAGSLVMTHLVPADEKSVNPGEWVKRPKKDFGGHVTLAKDLDVTTVGKK